MERPTARQSAWQWQERIGIRDRKTLDGDQSLFFNRLMDLGDPLEDFDAVNKKYVDDVFGDGEIIVVIGSVDDIADLDLDPGSIAGSDADAVMAVHLAMYDHTLIGSGVDLTEHLAAYDHTNIHPSNIIDGDTVDVSGRDTGDVLTWNGAMWVPAPSSGGVATNEYVTDPIEIDHAASSPVSLGTAPAYSIVELITRCTENESGCVLTIGDEDDADSHCTDALMPVATTDAPVVTPLSPQYYATAKALRATITTAGTAGKWNVQFKITLVG